MAFVAFSHNGKYRVVGTNEDARTKVTVYEGATDKVVPLPPLPEGDINAVMARMAQTSSVAFIRSVNRNLTSLTMSSKAEDRP